VDARAIARSSPPVVVIDDRKPIASGYVPAIPGGSVRWRAHARRRG
jgi:hypothetical protein